MTCCCQEGEGSRADQLSKQVLLHPRLIEPLLQGRTLLTSFFAANDAAVLHGGGLRAVGDTKKQRGIGAAPLSRHASEDNASNPNTVPGPEKPMAPTAACDFHHKQAGRVPGCSQPDRAGIALSIPFPMNETLLLAIIDHIVYDMMCSVDPLLRPGGRDGSRQRLPRHGDSSKRFSVYFGKAREICETVQVR